MFELLASTVVQGLKLWNTKEGRKYIDKVIDLETEWRKEFNRPDRSQKALDEIEDKMKLLHKVFMSIPTGDNK